MRCAAQLTHLHVAQFALLEAVAHQGVVDLERLCRPDRLQHVRSRHARGAGVEACHLKLAELAEELEQFRDARIGFGPGVRRGERANPRKRGAQRHWPRELVLLEPVGFSPRSAIHRDSSEAR